MTDILDLIDNATQNLCACGCGSKLPEGGPSAWFATPECQWQWNNERATDPGDVYHRPDADMYYPGPASWSAVAAERPDAVPQPRLWDRAAAQRFIEDRFQELYEDRRAAVIHESSTRTPVVIDRPRPGHDLCLFVGGWWHGHVRAIPAGSTVYYVPEPVHWYWTPESVMSTALDVPNARLYERRRVSMNLPPLPEFGLYRHWSSTGWAFTPGAESDEELRSAMEDAIGAGWRPWLANPAPEPVPAGGYLVPETLRRAVEDLLEPPREAPQVYRIRGRTRPDGSAPARVTVTYSTALCPRESLGQLEELAALWDRLRRMHSDYSRRLRSRRRRRRA